MRKVGILSDIIKRYGTKEEVECAGPKVFYYEFFNYNSISIRSEMINPNFRYP